MNKWGAAAKRTWDALVFPLQILSARISPKRLWRIAPGFDRQPPVPERRLAMVAIVRNLSIEPVTGIGHYVLMRFIVELVGEEWAEWYRLSPAQRWRETEKLWQAYLMLGGSLDPEPDSQSPFHDPEAPRSGAAHGRPGVRIVRRSRV